MSIGGTGGIDTKQAPIYVVIMVATIGSFVVTNNNDDVNLDRTVAIESNIEKIENRLQGIEDKLHDHEKLGAHQAQDIHTENFLEDIRDLKEDMQKLQDYLIGQAIG